MVGAGGGAEGGEVVAGLDFLDSLCFGEWLTGFVDLVLGGR